MKKILHIARNELYTLFYSPIAWILMILFLVMTSADYILVTDIFLGVHERGGPGLAMIDNLTSTILTNGVFGYFFGVIRNLYIFFPLITMGLISRETSSGTIRLLYSSPVRIREIVLGKYLAMLCYTLCLIVLLMITVIAFSFSVVYPDYGQIVSSLFGLFLVLATYAAIGLFISSLTAYQIVAALITLGVFALLGRVGELWQDIDIIRGITFYMNIGGKSYNFVRGLMNTRDFCYFLILIISFLLFTIIKIKSGTESISRMKVALRYVAVITVGFLIGYITNKPQYNAYWDTTRNQVHTITPPTQATVAKLNAGEMEITVFSNLLGGNFGALAPTEQNNIVTNTWEPYIRFKPDIHVKFVYYYDLDTGSYHYKLNPGKTLKEIAEKEAKTFRMDLNKFLTPEEVNKLVNVKAEEYRDFFQLKYKGKTVIVRTFDDQTFWPEEDEIAASLNRLVATAPKIAFLSGEIERGPFSDRTRDYRSIASKVGKRNALINKGYDFDTLSIGDKNIPMDIAALVIADPRTPIAPEKLAKINNYIDGGGNLLLTSEPDRREVTRPLFEKLGLSLRDGILVQPSNNYSSDCIFAYMTDTMKQMAPQFARFIKNDIKYWGDTLFRTAMIGSAAIDYKEKDGFIIDPLAKTDKQLSWNRLAPISQDSLQLKIGKMAGDEQGSFVTALRMHRNVNGRDQRIIVASDADYLSGVQVWGRTKQLNYDFGFWCFSYFSYGLFPANTLRPESLDNAFKIKVDNIPSQKLILYWVIPAFIAIMCSVVLIRRKRK